MAKKRINKEDIAPKGLFDNVIQGATDSKSRIDMLTASMKALNQVAQTTKKAMGGAKPNDTKGLKDFDDLTRRANATAKAKLNIDKQLLTEKAKLQQKQRELNKEIREEVQATSKLTKEQKKNLGTLQKIQIENGKLRSERARLNLETKKGQQRLKEINTQLDKNNAKIKASGDAMKKQRMNVGNYASAIGKLKSALGQLGIAFGVFSLIRSSFNVIRDFEQGQADLASVLGVNKNQMEALTDQAKELGSTTTFTASQVAELQKELAKLGFTQDQIEGMTESTLLLAEATGSELGRSAEVVGATMRGFGLEAQDSQRVVDVLAKSFSSSSLDMEKFANAMKSVAPVAKNAGFSIEQTTALIGTLTDRGIDASTAGTGLRNMFLLSGKAGLTLDQALEKINNSTDKTKTSFELFGQRGATLGVILAENQQAVGDLTDKLEDSDGAAKKMADTQRNTLGGALELLKSAWDGFILSMNEANGVGATLRKGVEFLAENLTTVLSVIGKLIKGFIVFKTTMLALKMADRVKEWKAAGGSLKNLTKGLDGASDSAKNFGRALKGIAFTAIISALIEMAQAWFAIASGAAEAERRVRKFSNAQSKGADQAQKKFEGLLKSQKEEIDAIRLKASEDKKAAKSTAERNKIDKEAEEQIKAVTEATKNQVDADVKRLQQEKISAFERKKSIKDQFDAFVKANGGIEKIRAAEASGVEALSKFLSKDGVSSYRRYTDAIADAAAQEANFAAKLEVARSFQSQLNDEVIDLTINMNANTSAINSNSDSKEDNTEKTKELVQAMDDFEKKLKDIDSAFESELEDEFGQENELIEKRLSERLKIITDQLRNEEITKEQFDFLRLEAELNTLNKLKALRILYAKDVTDINLQIAEKQLEITQFLNSKTVDDTKADEDREDELRRQQEAIELVTDFLTKEIDKRIAEIDREIEAHKKRASELEQLAKNGNILAQESIAEENRLIAEAEREREIQERRKQQILLVSSVLQAYNANLEAGQPSGEAFTNAVLSKAVLDQFISSLGSFYVGTEDTGKASNPLDENGGRLAVLHDNERVITAKQNKMIGNVSNQEVARVMEQRRLGNLIEGESQIISFDNQILVNELMTVSEKLDQVNKTIAEKPELDVKVGEITSTAMKIVENHKKKGVRTVNTFKVKAKA